MKKVAAIIPNFNMPERTAAIAEYLHANHVDCEIIVVDNGSSDKHGKFWVSTWATVLLNENIQTTGGWLMGMQYADALERKYKGSFEAYWLMITSMEFVPESKDPLAPMLDIVHKHPNVVGVHASLTQDSTTSWEHLKNQGPRGFRPAWMIDNVCALWRADWFNSIGRFDPMLYYAWGVDLETCYYARSQRKHVVVCDEIQVKKVTDIAYTMGRMGMSAEMRKELARANMDEVFTKKYGPGWRSLMYVE